MLIRNSAKKINDKKQDIKFEIDTRYVEAQGGDKELGRKINRYEQALKIAKNKGIATSIGVDSLSKESRSGDLLYLQGYWQLDSEVDRIRFAIDKQEVDADFEQQELERLKRRTS
ncbi:hypothetical protein [Abyssogena phaseoliformis symbiont]|uniref:hypothetical protein n=1 Tax=Abyssogena phaseoliformis symbiont TaxID=596095 RepID=UPI001915EA98|nr:hypothetical protein [Abyssogena phaseoliformis symbiont]